MDWLFIFFVFFMGALVGIIAGLIVNDKPPIGTLRIDTSDSFDGPYFFLELEQNIDNIEKMETIELKISTESYVTRN